MTEPTVQQVEEDMKRLIQPVMSAVEGCKSVEEILMLASIMITTGQEIMVSAIGRDNTNEMIQNLLKKD